MNHNFKFIIQFSLLVMSIKLTKHEKIAARRQFNDSIFTAPTKRSPVDRLVSHALFSVDNVAIKKASDAATIMFDTSLQLVVDALRRTRESSIAHEPSTARMDIDAVDKWAFAKPVRDRTLEVALKQRWRLVDPPGYDSCAVYDSIMASIDGDEVANKREKGQSLARLASTARGVKNKRLSVMKAPAYVLKDNEEDELNGLSAAADQYALETKDKLIIRLRKSVETGNYEILQLRHTTIPRTHIDIEKLLGDDGQIAAQIRLVDAQLVANRALDGTVPSADDPKALSALKSAVKRGKAKYNVLNERLKFLDAKLIALYAAVPKREARLQSIADRISVNAQKLAELEA